MSKTTKRIVNPDTGEILDPKTSPDYYTLDAIRHAEIWTPENIRTEYQRLYKIVSERMRVIGASEIGRQSKTYFYNKDKFKPVSQLKPYEQKILLAEAAQMIQAKTGTLGGIKKYRERAINKLHEHGITWVNEANFTEFGKFMAWWKDSRFRGYGSEVAAEFYNRLQSATAYERAFERSDSTEQLFMEFDVWQSVVNLEKTKARMKYGLGKGRELSSKELMNMLDEFLAL